MAELGDVPEEPEFALPVKQPAPKKRTVETPAAAGPVFGPWTEPSPVSDPALLRRLPAAELAFQGRPATAVVLTQQVPLAGPLAGEQLGVQVLEGRRVVIEAPGCAPSETEVPFYIEAGKGTATWDRTKGLLTLQLPIMHLEHVVADLRKLAPHSRAALQLSSVDEELV